MITDNCEGIEYEYRPVTSEAASLTLNGDRQRRYGHPLPWAKRCAAMWSVIFGIEVRPEQVAQAMIAFKLVREVHSPGRDNAVDICGYAEVMRRTIEAQEAVARGNATDTDRDITAHSELARELANGCEKRP